MFEREQALIDSGRDEGRRLAKKHAEWQESARKSGRELKKPLVRQESIIDYACKRPHLSGRQVEENTGENEAPRHLHGTSAQNEKIGIDLFGRPC